MSFPVESASQAGERNGRHAAQQRALIVGSIAEAGLLEFFVNSCSDHLLVESLAAQRVFGSASTPGFMGYPAPGKRNVGDYPGVVEM